MSKGNTTENDIALFIFNATAMPSYGSNIYCALYTSNPGEGGAPNNNECGYGSYARVAVSRDVAGWTVTGGTATNVGTLTFPTCTSSSETALYFGLVTSSSGGSGQILYSGELTSSLAISLNVTPLFAPGSLTITED